MTTMTLPANAPQSHTPGFFSQVGAEWTKLRSVRSFYIQAALAVILAIAMSALIGLAIGSSWKKMDVSDRATFDPIFSSLFGLAFSGIVLTVMGVTQVSSEYTSGMIRLTMAATPSRLRVLFSKALLIALVTWAIGAVVVIGAFFAGQTVLGSYAGVPTASLSDSQTQHALLGAWLLTPMFPLIGAALGAILRSTASAITATLALIFVPSLFGGLLPNTWQKHVLAYLPGNASDSFLRTDHTYLTYLHPAVAIFTIAVWLVLFYGVASFLIQRRNV